MGRPRWTFQEDDVRQTHTTLPRWNQKTTMIFRRKMTTLQWPPHSIPNAVRPTDLSGSHSCSGIFKWKNEQSQLGRPSFFDHTLTFTHTHTYIHTHSTTLFESIRRRIG